MFKSLENIREHFELTQRNMADILNITQQTYLMYEIGERAVPLKHLNTLSNYFNLSLDYLADLSTDKNRYNTKKLSHIDNKVVGKNFIYVRIKFNLTQRKLAESIDVSYGTISSIENGKTTLSTKIAIKLCKKYKLSLDWLCGKSENMFRTNFY